MTRHKIILELIQPGTWIIETAPGQPSNVSRFINAAISSFYEMNAALWVFDDARNDLYASFDAMGGVAEWNANNKRKQEIQSELERKNGYSYEIYSQAELIFKREQWTKGKLPHAIESAFPILHAHAFLYAIDQIGKYLSVIAGDASLNEATRAAARRFEAEFPQVREIRNSAAHKEDRLRGIGARKQPIPKLPVDAYGIRAPTGGVTVMSGLHEQTLTYTTASGHLGGLDITIQTLQGVQSILQTLLDTFAWEGPRVYHPS